MLSHSLGRIWTSFLKHLKKIKQKYSKEAENKQEIWRKWRMQKEKDCRFGRKRTNYEMI